MNILFLGPDGCGKSTIIGHITEKIGKDKCAYFHLRPVVYKHKIKKAQVNAPQSMPPYNSFYSFFKFIFLVCQFNFGWIRNVFRSNKTVIFDRYLYDILIDPLRFRLKLPTFILKSIYYLIPRPDKIFVLVGDAQTINNRKKEVTLKETERQLKIYNNYFSNKLAVVFVDTSRDLHVCLKDVEKEINTL